MSDETSAPWDAGDAAETERVAADVQGKVAGLRALADFIEQHPETHNAVGRNSLGLTINHACLTREEIVNTVRALGGKWEKVESEWYFSMRRSFGGLVDYDVFASRSVVCEKRVIGKKETVVEAPDPEAVAALPLVKQTVVEDEIEWVCPPSLLAMAGGGS